MEQTKGTKAAEKIQLSGHQEGAKHSYSADEVNTFTEHINFYLGDDPELATRLPLSAEKHDIFEAVGDGLILCKLINKAQPGTIDERAINKKKLTVFQRNENLNLAINSAKSIGCVVVNIHPVLIQEKRETIILGFIWQIIKAQMFANIDLKHHPYLIRLK